MWRVVLLILLMIGSASAGEIKGKASFNPEAAGKVKVSYEGLTKSGKKISDMAGLTIGLGDAWVWCKTHDPRRTGVKWNPEKGLTFQCLELPVGKYLIALKNMNYLDTKVVEIAKADDLVHVNFAVDREQTGKLKVNFNKEKGDYEVALAPIGNDEKPILTGVAPGDSYHIRVVKKVENTKTAKLEGLRPGKYHVMVRSMKKLSSDPSGNATMLTPVGAKNVAVEIGKESAVTIP